MDEFAINKYTWPSHEWSLPKTNIQLEQSQTYTKPYSVILAVSREKGIELVDIYEKAINKKKFKFFLERLRQLNYWNDITLMMDNVSFHKSGDIKERMNEVVFSYTFTQI